MIARRLRNLACAMLVLVSAGTRAARAATEIEDRAVERSSLGEYRLNPSDVLDLDFRFTPELNQSVTIRPDGLVSLHGAGEIQAAGLTIPELTRSLEQAYGALLRDSVISVSLKEFKKPYVVVNGEVERPGQYELRGRTTLTEAIAMAGGLKDSAKHSEVWLFHRLPEGAIQARQIDVKRMLAAGDIDKDPSIGPSDAIFVPKNTWSKVSRFIPVPGFGFFSPLP